MKALDLKRLLRAGAVLGMFALEVSALDPQRAITQARITEWTAESGLPQSTVSAIVQTRDGYLWAGTEEGLVRFDGIRFVVHDRRSEPQLRSSFISALCESDDGVLWIGTYGGGITTARGEKFHSFLPEQTGSDRIRAFHPLPDGTMLVATAGGGLLSIAGSRVTRFTMREGLPTDRIWAIEDDGSGGVWIATHGGGVVRWKNGSVIARISTDQGLPSDVVRALKRNQDGSLWIGTDGGGLVLWSDGRVAQKITAADGLPSDLIRALFVDREGSLWIGTDAGLARWRERRVESAGTSAGVRGSVRVLAEDREGNLWVGMLGGLARLTDSYVLPFTRKDGLTIDGVRPVVENAAGEIWAGTDGGGLCRLRPAPVRCLTTADGLPHDTIYALARARNGLWIGTDGGGVIRLGDDGRFHEQIGVEAGLSSNRVRALVETAAGDLWISTNGGLALWRKGLLTRVPALEGQQLRPLLVLPSGELLAGTDGAGLSRVSADGSRVDVVAAAAKGLRSDRVFSLAHDVAGESVWIGTSGGGLSRLELRTGAVRTLTRDEGLHDDVVFHVMQSGADLWLTSNRGLYRVSREQVLKRMRGLEADLRGTVYRSTDGMPSSECNAGFPGGLVSRDGMIWIPTVRGVGMINPRAPGLRAAAPMVRLENVLVDGSPVEEMPVIVPPGAERLDIRYTAPSFRAPETTTFRYRLEGYDEGWVEAGAERVAHYAKLPPGSYTFRLVAMTGGGTASEAEARLQVTVKPRWFETWWARLLAILSVLAVIWGAVRLRLNAIHERRIRRMAEELAETNRQLAVANERLRALSYVDGLTGLANRRRFDEALNEACSANGARVSLVLLDLDHFKRLNDTSGHQFGDDALRSIAALLAKQAESTGGLVARFGGEEFAWLLPGVSLAAAAAHAETVRLRIREEAIPHPTASSGIVTASLGVSSAVASSGAAAALVATADAALYRAKSASRDRVETAAE